MKIAKIIKTVLIVLLAAVIVLAGVFMLFKLFGKKHILDGPGMINTREGELVKVRYSCGGGMEGGSLYYSISCQDVTAFFEYESQPYNGAETETAAREVPLTYFDDFRQICRNTECLLDAHKGKESEFQMLDAPVSVITFTLADGTELSFRSDYEYPSNCDGLFSAVVTLFEEISSET